MIYAHPVPESFCSAVLKSVVRGLEQASHEIRIIDLYSEGFNPVLGEAERRTYEDVDELPAELETYFEALAWAEAMIFVYPTWWYGLPAILKGWLDRVWLPGVSFELQTETKRMTPKMQHIKKLAVVTTCGAPRFFSYMIGEPGRKTILRGVRALCSPRCKTLFLAHYSMDASTDDSRSSYLRRVETKLTAF